MIEMKMGSDDNNDINSREISLLNRLHLMLPFMTYITFVIPFAIAYVN